MPMRTRDIRRLPPMISTQQAAQILGMNPRSIARSLCEERFICGATKVGKAWRIPKAELLEAIGLGDYV